MVGKSWIHLGNPGLELLSQPGRVQRIALLCPFKRRESQILLTHNGETRIQRRNDTDSSRFTALCSIHYIVRSIKIAVKSFHYRLLILIFFWMTPIRSIIIQSTNHPNFSFPERQHLKEFPKFKVLKYLSCTRLEATQNPNQFFHWL